jgi:hypothetical protein
MTDMDRYVVQSDGRLHKVIDTCDGDRVVCKSRKLEAVQRHAEQLNEAYCRARSILAGVPLTATAPEGVGSARMAETTVPDARAAPDAQGKTDDEPGNAPGPNDMAEIDDLMIRLDQAIRSGQLRFVLCDDRTVIYRRRDGTLIAVGPRSAGRMR